ncbi:sporulation protein [Virgibacillus xinjiangensis]|uniref:Sporulation protein n=1 Tax=Virgibacillus xinjiangensis TaxID=393090 RepID=A0ABV7CU58_9BACI
MFKKILASVGIGNAKVDTQLEHTELVPGGPVRGKIIVQGGNTEQHVEKIQLFLMTEVVQEKDGRSYHEDMVLDFFVIGSSFTIGEGDWKEIDFHFTLPIHTPPTMGKTKVWIQTGMDVPNAIDPTDRDFIKISPHPYMETALLAVTDHLGFGLREVEMEYSRRYRYIQEFEFLPMNEFRQDLDELEAMFFVKPNGLDIILQIDRRAKGLGGLFAEALEIDEKFVRIRFSSAELDKGPAYIADRLRETIEQYC